jgi:hypothetical protein
MRGQRQIKASPLYGERDHSDLKHSEEPESDSGFSPKELAEKINEWAEIAKPSPARNQAITLKDKKRLDKQDLRTYLREPLIKSGTHHISYLDNLDRECTLNLQLEITSAAHKPKNEHQLIGAVRQSKTVQGGNAQAEYKIFVNDDLNQVIDELNQYLDQRLDLAENHQPPTGRQRINRADVEDGLRRALV